MHLKTAATGAFALVMFALTGQMSAQSAPPSQPPAQKPAAPVNGTTAPAAAPAVPVDYVIGPDDVLAIMVREDKEMTGEYVVRPDGIITIPLINDIQAAGLTTEQLREVVKKAATKMVVDPTVTVGVKQINSRRVHITGMVGKPGAYALATGMTVVQLIASAGGLHEFADSKKIMIVRTEGGKQVAFKFNYKDFVNGKNLKQNIELKPGDTIVVP
jgi:polysaccharide export outer membrane protein